MSNDASFYRLTAEHPDEESAERYFVARRWPNGVAWASPGAGSQRASAAAAHHALGEQLTLARSAVVPCAASAVFPLPHPRATVRHHQTIQHPHAS